MNDLNEEKIASTNHLAKKRALRSLISILISLTLLIIIYFLIYFSQSLSQITFAKNQILETYETQTIGTALDNFFYHPTWSSSTENLITFTGEAYWEKKKLFSHYSSLWILRKIYLISPHIRLTKIIRPITTSFYY